MNVDVQPTRRRTLILLAMVSMPGDDFVVPYINRSLGAKVEE